MRLHAKLPKTPKTELQLMLDDLEIYMKSTVALNEAVRPRCRCGETEHLQDGRAAGSIIWYCPVCRADEDTR